MKKSLFWLIAFGAYVASAQRFHPSYENPASINHESCIANVIFRDVDTKLSNSKFEIENVLSSKGYQEINFSVLGEQRFENGSLELNLGVSAGLDPYIPLKYLCSGSAELITSGDYELISKAYYDGSSVFMRWKGCEQKIIETIEMMPNCK